MVTISDIARALETWAPAGTAQSYDNVGLQVGDPASPVECAVVALDATPDVIDEGLKVGAQLIVTHHPLLFQPLRSVRAGEWHGEMVLRLARAGIALYAIHTNLDAANGGVSVELAQRLGAAGIDFLRPLSDSVYKLVVFVPESHFESVRRALAEAGAGTIGNYDSCGFSLTGEGYFRPGPGASPHIGQADGPLERVNERRIEVEVARWRLDDVLCAMRAVHPYETVAYDVYPVVQPFSRTGMGAIGTLPEPASLREFLGRVRDVLHTAVIRYAGDPSALVRRVAVCGGSGGDLIGDALRAGADVFVTADLGYHRFFEGLGASGLPRMAIVDAGHYETEWHTEELLSDWLATRFEKVRWIRTSVRTSPVRAFP
jgi:dinuclear metal center YbgI/SA1388 family protein